ncbi:uncharacterized protein [Haliotis cracherodii]|uniref:uncharacterized protein n=1 Tax=Haliotis cracherodii TaxID=6455 RepID=UPI0039E7D6C9
MELKLVCVFLAIVGCSQAQQYTQIWNDMLNGNSPPLTTTLVGLFFRNMMRPQPGATTPTATSRNDFKFYWINAYLDTEKIADGLFSYFDGVRDEVITEEDILPMMNIADTDGSGTISRAEFNAYMDLAYAYAGNQRLLPSGVVHHNTHPHVHADNVHVPNGRPFLVVG